MKETKSASIALSVRILLLIFPRVVILQNTAPTNADILLIKIMEEHNINAITVLKNLMLHFQQKENIVLENV
jgi:hypothetical protein